MITRTVVTAVITLSLSVPLSTATTSAPARPGAHDGDWLLSRQREQQPGLGSWHRPGPANVAALSSLTYVAHRGGSPGHPENSMSALDNAFRGGAAQVLDFDTRMLRDGTLVALHDATLDRTTDRQGPVRALNARQWRQVRLRPRPGAGDEPVERPPTVREVLDRFGGHSVLMLEVKDPRALPELARMIHARGLTRSVFVASRRPAVARAVHRKGLLAQLWRSAGQLRNDRPERWRGFVSLLDVDHRARAGDLRRAVASGIPRVWAHTVNTPADRDRALRLGCQGIVTDLLALLASIPAHRS
ncbi:glycerophosphodiester phosphodiesterase [Streptomyces zagrosensis]|uniref:Glycerophosphoryl diester phosphodiesterase n=1 Tax=Streptomyces zagrosensis TaxID=1042984 RepID=A0A7W9Q4A6_9ACTN|nr:glycerophosphodiester phosphodiesterase family protein [Streptomyces zagrosensis]MBB5933280.1 glycerophosphoryl diester phosphodiesterase [Streptomyces zagrosensis]